MSVSVCVYSLAIITLIKPIVSELIINKLQEKMPNTLKRIGVTPKGKTVDKFEGVFGSSSL